MTIDRVLEEVVNPRQTELSAEELGAVRYVMNMTASVALSAEEARNLRTVCRSCGLVPLVQLSAAMLPHLSDIAYQVRQTDRTVARLYTAYANQFAILARRDPRNLTHALGSRLWKTAGGAQAAARRFALTSDLYTYAAPAGDGQDELEVVCAADLLADEVTITREGRISVVSQFD